MALFQGIVEATKTADPVSYYACLYDPCRVERYGPFQQMENKLEHEKHPPRDPAAVAAKIGRDTLGQKEMTRRSVAGKEKNAASHGIGCPHCGRHIGAEHYEME